MTTPTRPNKRTDFPAGTRVARYGDGRTGTVVQCPPGEYVLVWWDHGKHCRHHIRTLTWVAASVDAEWREVMSSLGFETEYHR